MKEISLRTSGFRHIALPFSNTKKHKIIVYVEQRYSSYTEANWLFLSYLFNIWKVQRPINLPSTIRTSRTLYAESIHPLIVICSSETDCIDDNTNDLVKLNCKSVCVIHSISYEWTDHLAKYLHRKTCDFKSV